MNSVANVLLALCLLHPALTFGDERPDLQQIQDVVQRFYEAWNQQDFVVAEDLIGESVVEIDMRSRQEPQTWILRKAQSREEFLDGIVVEWTGGDAWDYGPGNPPVHQEGRVFRHPPVGRPSDGHHAGAFGRRVRPRRR